MKARLLFLFITVLFPDIASAGKWVEGAASMKIGNTPFEEVRRMTIKNAVADASYRGGYMISAQDVMLNGVLLDSTIKLNTVSSVRSVDIQNESIINDILTIYVSVELAEKPDCERTKHKKNIVIAPFYIDVPSQTTIGQIFDIGHVIGSRFHQQVTLQSTSLNATFINKFIGSKDIFLNKHASQLAEFSQFLLKEFNSQYVLFGKIDDIGMIEKTQVSGRFRISNTQMHRNFTISLFILDTIQQSIIYEDRVNTSARWEHSLHEVIDLSSSAFWRSQFGTSLLNLVAETVEDIDHVIQCKPAFSLISSQQHDDYLIQLGEKHGIKKGDKFSLFKRSSTDHSGLWRSKLTEDENVYFIAQDIYHDFSFITPSDAAKLDNHLFDVVSSAEMEE